MKKTKTIIEFGIKRENEERRDGGCGVVFNPYTQLYAVGKRDIDGLLLLFSGGIASGEDTESGVLREIREESGLYDFCHVEKIAEALTHYHNKTKNINRVALATCFLVILNSASLLPTQLEAHEHFTLNWYPAKEILEHWQGRNQEENYSHWIYFFKKSIARAAALGYDSTSKI
ncbi:MAG: hypothetical protein UW74_C0040G0007 [Candidatus Giovannonibacteria bacterium GW2011_GWC2_44_8]|uniref:Nudix hydrolase domain-containing protein n=1 Tax=Candidatus Giovannonibacteria bacterium GW2011_GWC2_44_8 TaxID=1618657 RepID=A0A0G1K0U6_9BACT|nr:MAG: hypothetical protein UW74_C0040G0007 [Candidatus Giovannonibacteria bacterium GW2011_GWC2_44_8]